MPRLALLGFVAALLVGAAIRVRTSDNDLWLDEIWSLEMARHVASPLEIFTVARHDNNHFLNTLYLYALRDRDESSLLRAHSLAAGLGAIFLAWKLGRRWGAHGAALAAVLVASSYPMILYASEARGYALAVFFALASFAVMERHLDAPRIATAVIFGILALLGILSHLTYLHAYLAIVAWSVVRWCGARSPRAVVLEAARCHLPPLLGLAALYVVSIRGMTIGGGAEPGASQLDGVLDTLSLLVGGPLWGPGRALCAAAAAGLLLWGLRVVWKRSASLGIFFATATILSPAALTPLSSLGFVFPRYFLVSMAMALLLVAACLADLSMRGATARWICVAAVVLMIAGNGSHTASLLRYGRGQYRDAVRLLADRGNGRLVVAGDHEIRVGFVLAHYLVESGLEDRLVYADGRPGPPPQAQAWIAHSLDPDADAPAQIRDGRGRPFELLHAYRHGPLSGITWFVYAGDVFQTPDLGTP